MLIGGAALMLLTSSAHAGTIRHDVPDSSYTSLAADPKYQAVGMIDIGGFALGSGTLINPVTVLTAAHVVDGSPGYLNFHASDGSIVAADSWLYHNSWTGSLANGYDIAVITLAAPILTITPATLYDETDEVGRVLTAVGYGKTGTGLTGSTLAAGTRRAGQNVVDGAGGGIVGSLNLAGWSADILFSDFDSPLDPGESLMGSSTPLALEYSTAPGDSGGGNFFDINGGTYLFGVTSFGASIDGLTDSDYGDIFGSTRVSSFIGWITANISGSVTLFSTSGGGGGAIPEPASLGVVATVVWGLYLTGRHGREFVGF